MAHILLHGLAVDPPNFGFRVPNADTATSTNGGTRDIYEIATSGVEADGEAVIVPIQEQSSILVAPLVLHDAKWRAQYSSGGGGVPLVAEATHRQVAMGGRIRTLGSERSRAEAQEKGENETRRRSSIHACALPNGTRLRCGRNSRWGTANAPGYG